MKKGVRLLSFALAALCAVAALLAAPGCSQTPALSGSSASGTSSLPASASPATQSEVSRPQDDESRPLSPEDHEYEVPEIKNGKYVLFDESTKVIAEKDGKTLKHVKIKIKDYDYDDPHFEELPEPEFIGALMIYDSKSPEGRLLKISGRNINAKQIAKYGDYVYIWLSGWWAFSEGTTLHVIKVDMSNETIEYVTENPVRDYLLLNNHLYMIENNANMLCLSITDDTVLRKTALPECMVDIVADEYNGVFFDKVKDNIITFEFAESDISQKVNLRYNLDTGAFEYDADPRDFDD